jgi:hypothetical protein
VVKDQNSLHDAGDPVGTAAELSQETPAFEGAMAYWPMHQIPAWLL